MATPPAGAATLALCAASWPEPQDVRPCARRHGLQDRHEALPQELDTRTAIALTLQERQAVDMALDGAIAPGQREASFNRREILLEALGKARQRVNPTRGR